MQRFPRFNEGLQIDIQISNLTGLEHDWTGIFYVSSFFYTINYTWVLYTDLKEKYNRTVNGFSQVGSNHAYRVSRIVTILSGVIPVLLMAPVFWGGNVAKCYQNFSQPYKCLLMHTGTLEPDTGYSEGDTQVCHAMHYYSTGVFLLTFFCTFTGSWLRRWLRFDLSPSCQAFDPLLLVFRMTALFLCFTLQCNEMVPTARTPFEETRHGISKCHNQPIITDLRMEEGPVTVITSLLA
ncbi:UNVERIFIED_CONTAM: hypothetical protein FKN15_020768 [Acipenser sinensis]